jgi:hypothetical protein
MNVSLTFHTKPESEPSSCESGSELEEFNSKDAQELIKKSKRARLESIFRDEFLSGKTEGMNYTAIDECEFLDYEGQAQLDREEAYFNA